jgi:hypothetical protein
MHFKTIFVLMDRLFLEMIASFSKSKDSAEIAFSKAATLT